jgi:hypothetical protein
MRKLSLRLDDLSVESFETAEDAENRGTVLGNESDWQRVCSGDLGTCGSCQHTDCDCGSNNCNGGGDDTMFDTCETGQQRICGCW